jgi:hypothetical protein
MTPQTLQDLSLENVGFQTRTFRFLRNKALGNLEELLQSDPATISSRAATWSDVHTVLGRLSQKLEPQEQDRIKTFLASGDQAANDKPARPEEESFPHLPPPLKEIYKTVRSSAHPQTRRSLARSHQLPRTLLPQLSEAPFVAYPYGLHGWVGLREWGVEGYRKAARTSWNILPLHLQRLTAKGESLPPEAWQAISDVAAERRDLDMLFVATESLQSVVETVVEVEVETAPETVAPETGTASVVAETAPEYIAVAPDPVAEPQLKREQSAYAKLPTDLQELLKKSQPRLFKDLEYDDLQGGVEALAEAAKDLPRPFSLAELGPTSGDVLWLTRWAKALDGHEAREWIEALHPLVKIGPDNYWAGNECLGILLLFLCSETGRRNAQEGKIWTEIPSLFSPSSRAELFQGGQPRTITRRAIEGAAKRFGVRHAFGQEGSHAWYQTIYLQFGFTKTGVQTLPVWLSSLDLAPNSVARLYEESFLFKRLWDSLHAYRRKAESADQATNEIQANPFTLDSWTSEILEAAAYRFRDDEQDDLLDPDRGALQAALRWPPSEQPVFELTWHSLATLGLVEPGYEVHHDGSQLARLTLQESGYQSYPTSFSVSLDSPYLTLELEGEEGEDEQEVDLTLWDTDQDFHLFDAESGLPLNRDKVLNTRRDLLVLTAPGRWLEPVPAKSKTLGRGETLSLLTAPWDGDTSVVDDSGVVANLTTRTRPQWIEECQLVCAADRFFMFGDQVPVFLRGLPADARVLAARAFAQPVKFTKNGTTWDSLIQLEPSVKSSSISVRFTVRCSTGNYSFQRSAQVKINDVAIKLGDQESWTAFENLPRLTARELSQAKVRFFHPDHSRYGLMGGTTFLQRPPRRLTSLELPGGYGEPLTIWEGPYNRVPNSDYWELCQEFLDCGLIKKIDWQDQGTFQLHLARAIEPGPDHFLLFWNVQGEVAFLTAVDLLHCNQKLWVGKVEGFSGPVSVALGYEDRRLGTARSPGFEPPWDDKRSARTAGLLRWMKLPLLRTSWRQNVQSFARSNMKDCLAAWVFNTDVSDVPAKLALEDTEEWQGVIRTLLHDTQWNRDNYWKIWIQLLDIRQKGVTPSEQFLRLLMALPLTALDLGKEVLKDQEQRDLVEGLSMAPIGTPRFKNKLEALRREAAAEMLVRDDRFVDSLIERLDSRVIHEKENLQLALHRPAFVRYLACSTINGWLQHT